MQKIRVVYIKVPTVMLSKKEPASFIEQEIISESENINIPVYAGHVVVSVTQLFPLIIQKNEKKN